MIRRISIGALVVVALAAIAGCKQGDGERCLVDSDCSSGLTCNTAQQQCQPPGTVGGIDATVPDAPVLMIDAPPPPIDAPPPPPIDAPPIDAP